MYSNFKLKYSLSANKYNYNCTKKIGLKLSSANPSFLFFESYSSQIFI